MRFATPRFPTALAGLVLLILPWSTPRTASTAAEVHRQGANDLPLSPSALTLDGVIASTVTHEGSSALRLLERDNKRAGGVALLPGVTLTNGVIELDVAGRRGPYAVPDDRGFIGVAFRVRPGASEYEYVYVRPDNGRVLDQVRRNHATQYGSHPAFSFDRLRKESPERYESYVDLEYGRWTSLRVEVEGTAMRLFVHGAPQPALVVTDLKLGSAGGGVALWIGAGTEGFFRRVRVTPRQ